VVVGVGDGPWDDMRKFDDKIPARDFDNFQVLELSGLQLNVILIIVILIS
jgi:E3 ubiquitin-protein ligase RGLG